MQIFDRGEVKILNWSGLHRDLQGTVIVGVHCQDVLCHPRISYIKFLLSLSREFRLLQRYSRSTLAILT